MKKFLSKIQFSIELTMWFTVLVALAGLSKVYYRQFGTCSAGLGAKLPELTQFMINSFGYLRWWMIPIVFFALLAIEWKFAIPKWLQWIFKLSLFALTLIAILAIALPMFTLCSVIK